MEIGFYIDQTRCIGCYTCAVSCKDWHDIPAGPANWMRVSTIERGKYPQPFITFLPVPCYHCAEPACVSACPVNAITKRREDGIVLVDREDCIGGDGCRLCLEDCPYQAPQFGAEENPKMQKCDLCLERWQEEKKPICVMACPMEALDAGDFEELKARYGEVRDATGFVYSTKTRPTVTLRPRLWSRPTPVR